MTAVVFQVEDKFFDKYNEVKNSKFIKWFVEYPHINLLDEFNELTLEDHINRINSGRAYRY